MRINSHLQTCRGHVGAHKPLNMKLVPSHKLQETSRAIWDDVRCVASEGTLCCLPQYCRTPTLASKRG